MNLPTATLREAQAAAKKLTVARGATVRTLDEIEGLIDRHAPTRDVHCKATFARDNVQKFYDVDDAERKFKPAALAAAAVVTRYLVDLVNRTAEELATAEGGAL